MVSEMINPTNIVIDRYRNGDLFPGEKMKTAIPSPKKIWATFRGSSFMMRGQQSISYNLWYWSPLTYVAHFNHLRPTGTSANIIGSRAAYLMHYCIKHWGRKIAWAGMKWISSRSLWPSGVRNQKRNGVPRGRQYFIKARCFRDT